MKESKEIEKEETSFDMEGKGEAMLSIIIVIVCLLYSHKVENCNQRNRTTDPDFFGPKNHPMPKTEPTKKSSAKSVQAFLNESTKRIMSYHDHYQGLLNYYTI